MFKFLKDKIKKVVDNVKQKIHEDTEIIKKDVIEDKIDTELNKENEELIKEDILEENLKISDNEQEIKKEVNKIKNDILKNEKDEIGKITEEIIKDKPIEFVKEKIIENKKQIIDEEDIEKTTNEKDVSIFVNKKTKKGFFSKLRDKITTIQINETKFDELFWDLEIGLLENNVAIEVIEKIKEDLKIKIIDKSLPSAKIEKLIMGSLKNSIEEILTFEDFNLIKKIKEHDKPVIILFLGINGTGKTTTIAKFIKLFKNNNISTSVAASDTFRAAAIDQLKVHTDKLNVKLIRHDYGSDPAAVAFDTIKYAKAKGIDVVLIDTAGRMHSNSNLMDELKKIIRVSKPDIKIFVGDALTGNDCVEQATKFNEITNIDGIVISKADVDEKGGTALSVAYTTKKPLLYLGIGQNYEDLEKFNKEKILKLLGF